MPNDYNFVPPSYGFRGPQHYVRPPQEFRNREETNFNRPPIPMYQGYRQEVDLYKTLVIMCQETVGKKEMYIIYIYYICVHFRDPKKRVK